MKLANYHSRLIFGCYRADQFSDPEVFVTAVASILAQYPQEVGGQLSNPKTGIAGQCKWPPSIAEIREACDRFIAPAHRAMARQASIEEQFQEREKWDGAPRVPQPEPRGQILSNYDEAVAKHGRPFGVFEKDRQLPYRG